MQRYTILLVFQNVKTYEVISLFVSFYEIDSFINFQQITVTIVDHVQVHQISRLKSEQAIVVPLMPYKYVSGCHGETTLIIHPTYFPLDVLQQYEPRLISRLKFSSMRMIIIFSPSAVYYSNFVQLLNFKVYGG